MLWRASRAAKMCFKESVLVIAGFVGLAVVKFPQLQFLREAVWNWALLTASFDNLDMSRYCKKVLD